MRTVGRLLRLSLTATAIADVAAGVVLGAGFWPAGPGPWLLILASLCVYHGGMALNDWADREHDAATRPERPLPSGQLSARAALGLALALLALGPVLALFVHRGAGAALGAAALLAVFYDLHGRGPWLGPLLLGLCRTLNLGCGLTYGLALAEHPSEPAFHFGLLAYPATYGLYVFVVSRLGRLEDREDDLAARKVHPRWLVVSAAGLLCAPLLLAAAGVGRGAAWPALALGLALTAFGVFGLLGLVRGTHDWTPASIGAAMGMALRRLLVFTSAVAVVTGGRDGMIVGLILLAGYPLSHALRRVFPPS